MALISLIILYQPVNEMNLWTLYAIPFLLLGGILFLGGVITALIGLIDKSA
jgi:hypothetical protein